MDAVFSIPDALWQACIDFHGHACGGLAIGYQASRYVMELFAMEQPCVDEEVVCIAENDACGIDAIQLMLGCTLGKGNLLLRLRGKQAFSFYQRETGQSLRLVLRATPEKSREERLRWLMQSAYRDMFDVKPALSPLPELARIFPACRCAGCGETTAENYLRVHAGQYLCLDCYPQYKRILD